MPTIPFSHPPFAFLPPPLYPIPFVLIIFLSRPPKHHVRRKNVAVNKPILNKMSNITHQINVKGKNNGTRSWLFGGRRRKWGKRSVEGLQICKYIIWLTIQFRQTEEKVILSYYQYKLLAEKTHASKKACFFFKHVLGFSIVFRLKTTTRKKSRKCSHNSRNAFLDHVRNNKEVNLF